MYIYIYIYIYIVPSRHASRPSPAAWAPLRGAERLGARGNVTAHGRPWWEGAVETGKAQVTFGWEVKIHPKDPESLYVFFHDSLELDGDELNGI